MKKVIYMSILSALQISSLHSAEKVLQYRDFGPQALAHKSIGMEWWQWEKSGSSDATKLYPINVVVYWDQTLDYTKKKFPTNSSKNQDYRYLNYHAAVKYLKSAIKEMTDAKLDNSRLKQTLSTLQNSVARHVQAKEVEHVDQVKNNVPPLQFFVGSYRMVGVDPKTMQATQGVCVIKNTQDGNLTLTRIIKGKSQTVALEWLHLGAEDGKVKPKLKAELSPQSSLIFDWNVTDGNYARLIGYHMPKGKKLKHPPAFELLECLHMDLTTYLNKLKKSLKDLKEKGDKEAAKKVELLLKAAQSNQ